MKYTPGPWVIVGQPGYSAPIIRNDTRPSRDIAKILYDGGSEDKEVDANAKLIARAPDLLELAKWALDYADRFQPQIYDDAGWKQHERLTDKAKAIIAEVNDK